jgi:hypothetical protein
MTMLERLRTTLTALSLTAIDARLETLLEAPRRKNRTATFLFEVMSAEADARRRALVETNLPRNNRPQTHQDDEARGAAGNGLAPGPVQLPNSSKSVHPGCVRHSQMKALFLSVALASWLGPRIMKPRAQ